MRVALLGPVLVAALASPASAVGAGVGVSAPISVDSGGGACVTVSAPGTYVGQFSAAGTVTAIVQDGVVKVFPIAGVVPLVGSGTRTYCIAGAPTPARSGTVAYEVNVSTVTGDYAEAKVCVFGTRSASCV